MIAIVVTVDASQPDAVELAADELWSLGVVAIEERVVADGTTIELWTSLGDDAASLRDDLARLRHPWRFEDLDESVSETWREFAEPTWVADDLVVVPSWKPPVTIDGAIEISIDPGATFGMGDHPTTVLTMRAMRTALRPGASVLDVGCGSGVLAIAACRLGADHADGIDISPAAVPTTLANAERNGVAGRVHVSTTALADLAGTYDVVVANILAPALIDMADDLRRVLVPGGSLVISGILADRHDHVLAALDPLRVVDRVDQDGWTAITLRH